MQAYAVCNRVTPECRQMELEMIGDGWGRADEAYHDTRATNHTIRTWTPSDIECDTVHELVLNKMLSRNLNSNVIWLWHQL